MDKAAPVGTADRASGFTRRQVSGHDLRGHALEQEPPETQNVRLKRLVLENFDFIWRTLRRLGVPDGDVDDAAQDVFMVLSRRLDDVDAAAERSFLIGTAVRVASTWRRTVSRRREALELDLFDRADPGPGPEELTDRQRCREALQNVLEQMSLEHRTVFVLFELEQLAVPDIAELLGVPVGTVASRLRRARELFLNGAKRYQARQAFEENKP